MNITKSEYRTQLLMQAIAGSKAAYDAYGGK